MGGRHRHAAAAQAAARRPADEAAATFPEPEAEPVIGLPGTTQPGTSTPAGRGGQGK